MTNKTFNYKSSVKLEVMSGIFFDPDLDINNHSSRDFLTITATESGSSNLNLTLKNSTNIFTNTNSCELTIAAKSTAINKIGKTLTSTIVVTATDSQGQAASFSFNATLTNNAPSLTLNVCETGTTTPVTTMSENDYFDVIIIVSDSEQGTDITNITHIFEQSRGILESYFELITTTTKITDKVKTIIYKYKVLNGAQSGILTATVTDECGLSTIKTTQLNIDTIPPTIEIFESVTVSGTLYTSTDFAYSENTIDEHGTYSDIPEYLVFEINRSGDGGTDNISYKIDVEHSYGDGTLPISLAELKTGTDNFKEIELNTWTEVTANVLAKSVLKLVPTRNWNGFYRFTISAKDSTGAISQVAYEALVAPVQTKPIVL